VQRAIDMAERALATRETTDAFNDGSCASSTACNKKLAALSVATLGPLIHNPAVVAHLSAEGLEQIDDVHEARPGQTVVIRSHGVAPDVIRDLESRGCDIVDATCPHVMRAQRGAAALAKKGCEVLVVGEPGHPEVEGIVAYAREAGADTHVISSAADVSTYLENRRLGQTKPNEESGEADADAVATPSELSVDSGHIGVVVQTTQRREALDEVLKTLREGGIEPIVKDTICTATTERQRAADALSRRVDMMVVIGGRNSSNTTRLAEICASNCPTFHIETTDELDDIDLSAVDCIGVTAGASTPESQINTVIDYLRRKDNLKAGSDAAN
jgi:4-hydroxy-3-methylbut-2-enyl diphosphate reductase